MAFKVKCPECGAGLLATEEAVGSEMNCTSCFASFPTPAPHASPATPRPPGPPPNPPASPPPARRPAARPWHSAGGRPAPDRPSSRRGPVILIAVIVGALLLGSFACCGGGYFLLPGEQWRAHQSQGGGYSVEMPVEPKRDMQIPGMKPEPGVQVEGGILWKRGECYVVMHGDTAPRAHRAVGDEGLLREAVNAMSNDPDVKRIVRDEPVTVSGFPGREVEFLGTDRGTYVARVVIADRRVYVLTGGGRFVRPGNANVRRFLDSFAVTDPTLQGGEAFEKVRREEEARKEAERIAAAERARKEAEHRARENEAFRNAAHAGPRPGDPREFSRAAGDLMHFSFDTAPAGGVGQWGPTRPLIAAATTGPGVRNGAAYLTAKSAPNRVRLSFNESPVRGLPEGSKGFTVSGWYRARHRGLTLLAHYPPSDGLAFSKPADLQVVVGPKAIAVRQNSRGGASELTAPRPVDEAWHHVAVRYEPRGDEFEVALFVDGRLASSGPGDGLTLHASHFAMGLPLEGADGWPALRDSNGRPTAGDPADLIGAVDECSLIDRPLTRQEVEQVAGLAPIKPRDVPQYGPKFETPFPVPDPVQFGGLRTYFPFEELDGVLTRDAAGELVGRCNRPELVAGPRGRALRAESVSGIQVQYSGPFYLHSGPRLTIDKGKPFTLALWVRTEADKPQPSSILYGGTGDISNTWFFLIHNDIRDGKVSFAYTEARKKSGESKEPKGSREGALKPGVWTHVAVSRDEKGKFRLAVDGEAAEVSGESDREIMLRVFILGRGSAYDPKKSNFPEMKPFTAEFDELCVFDRQLTDDELAALAGRKAMPKK